jgi:hypothetical protein
MDSFYSKVAGVTHKNKDGSSRQELIQRFVVEGQPLIFVPEPENKFDPNAIAVYVDGWKPFRTVRVQIGYLEARVAEELQSSLQSGEKISGIVTAITGGDHGKVHGVNIQITIESK